MDWIGLWKPGSDCSSSEMYLQGSTKTQNPHSGNGNGIQKRKRNMKSNINDRKLKNFTLHNLVQPEQNLF